MKLSCFLIGWRNFSLVWTYFRLLLFRPCL